MKGFLGVSWVILLVLVLGVADLQAEAKKIGVVDLQICIRESFEGKKIYDELSKKKDAMQKRLDEKQNELLKLKEEIDKQGMMLSMDAKEDKEKEFERKRREFKYFYDDLSEEMRKAEAEAKKDMLKDLEKVVSEIGKKEGLSLIFERRSSGLMYVSETMDISQQVLKAYNELKKK